MAQYQKDYGYVTQGQYNVKVESMDFRPRVPEFESVCPCLLCRILSKLLTLSVSQFPYLQNGNDKDSTQIAMRNKQVNSGHILLALSKSSCYYRGMPGY